MRKSRPCYSLAVMIPSPGMLVMLGTAAGSQDRQSIRIIGTNWGAECRNSTSIAVRLDTTS